MPTLLRAALCLLVALVFSAAGLLGADADTAPNAKQKAKKSRGADSAWKMPAGIELTSDQQTKLEDLKKQFAPKLEEVRNLRRSVMNPDRRKAEAEARKTAKAAGKKGKEARTMVQDALHLSDAEKAQLADVEKSDRELRRQISEAKRALLTDEQKAKLPKGKGKGKKAAA